MVATAPAGQQLTRSSPSAASVATAPGPATVTVAAAAASASAGITTHCNAAPATNVPGACTCVHSRASNLEHTWVSVSCVCLGCALLIELRFCCVRRRSAWGQTPKYLYVVATRMVDSCLTNTSRCSGMRNLGGQEKSSTRAMWA
jgi:hypothetical protein